MKFFKVITNPLDANFPLKRKQYFELKRSLIVCDHFDYLKKISMILNKICIFLVLILFVEPEFNKNSKVIMIISAV